MLVKEASTRDASCYVYLDAAKRRVIATATILGDGHLLVYGPEDTIILANSEAHADRIAESFALAAL